MNIKQQSYLYLHIAVFLFGFTGILGALIELPAVTLVWWRALITWIGLVPLLYFMKEHIHFESKNFKRFFYIGGIVAIHWICFYGSIKLSNSSVAMICLSTIPVFTSIFDSLINKKSFNKNDILTGIAIIPGMWLIIQNISTQFQLGFVVGIAAAIFSALFTNYNKKYINDASSYQITAIELFSVWCFISVILPFYYYFNDNRDPFVPNYNDWIYLIILAVICTIVAFILMVKSLHHLSPFAAMLCFNLEPVYGILCSALILHEYKQLNTNFYIGVILILATILLHPILTNRKSNLANP